MCVLLKSNLVSRNMDQPQIYYDIDLGLEMVKLNEP